MNSYVIKLIKTPSQGATHIGHDLSYIMLHKKKKHTQTTHFFLQFQDLKSD
jgi:hypothetical protein